jgi:hypothetical protein
MKRHDRKFRLIVDNITEKKRSKNESQIGEKSQCDTADCNTITAKANAIDEGNKL